MDETYQHACDRHREIARALIQRTPHVRLYETSPTFRHMIDTLATWLPGWVNGMASQARDHDTHTAYLAELAKRQLWPHPGTTVQERAARGEPDAVRRMTVLRDMTLHPDHLAHLPNPHLWASDRGTPITRQEIQGDVPPTLGVPERCPDSGTCHHQCPNDGRCWRVDNAGPLSGVYPGDSWPAALRSADGIVWPPRHQRHRYVVPAPDGRCCDLPKDHPVHDIDTEEPR